MEGLGANVRKGEKATLIVFWKFWRDEDEADEEDNKSNQRCMARAYFVFNAAQVAGYSLPEIPKIPEVTRIATAEAFFRATGATIKEQGTRAFYRPSTDEITMPPFAHFKMPEDLHIPAQQILAHVEGSSCPASACDSAASTQSVALPKCVVQPEIL